ncbi:hypothetical protein DB30_07334 [Enhygromyxa salina]|uniref:Uncharacterized protein n=1 Tax=Enhygromyxa salina TaxID=215803 RepID=A0A0C2D1F8_9BACT|nr:exo-alpha-sialidase [Enhygromyxa salina]KIG13997.1 hypothetical protein DB30_07334 [Enhygromyxa salina]
MTDPTKIPEAAANLEVKMFTIAVDSFDPVALVFSLVKDVVGAVFSRLVDVIRANQKYANPPSAVQLPTTGNFFVFYQNGSTGQLMYGRWDGSTWTDGNVIPDVTMSAGPGAVVFNNTIYVFFQGAENNGTLWYITSTDGSSWSAARQVPGASLNDSPSAAVLNGSLHVFYRQGKDLHQCSSTDGDSWSGISAIILGTIALSCSPSATVFESNLRVFYQGCSGSAPNGKIYYVKSTDGSNWGSSDTQVSGQPGIVGTPSAVCYNDSVYLLYMLLDGTLWYTKSSNGSSWLSGIQAAPLQLTDSPAPIVFTPPGGKSQIYYLAQGVAESGVLWCNTYNGSQWTSMAPAAHSSVMSRSPGPVVYNGRLYAFYKGADNESLYYSESSDGVEWSGSIQVPDAGLRDTPNAIAYQGNLYVFYRGGSNGLWYSRYDGSSWSQSLGGTGQSLSTAPSSVVFNNKIYLFHNSNSAGSTDMYWSTFDGKNWTKNVTVPGVYMQESPSAVVFNGKIYVFYQSSDPGALFYKTFDGNSSWSETLFPNCLPNNNPYAAQLASNGSPGAVVYNGKIHVFYQASDATYTWQGGNGLLGYFSSSDGQHWSWSKPQVPASSQSPTGVVVALAQDEWDAVSTALKLPL